MGEAPLLVNLDPPVPAPVPPVPTTGGPATPEAYQAIYEKMERAQRRNPERFAKVIAPRLATMGEAFAAGYAPYAQRAAQNPWTTAPVAGQFGESIRRGIFGGAQTLLAGPALLETMWREGLNVGAETVGLDVPFPSTAPSFGFLAMRQNLDKRMEDSAALAASYDPRQGVLGAIERGINVVGESAPGMLLGGAAGLAKTGATRGAQLTAQALMAGGQAGQSAAAAVDEGGVTGREIPHVLAQATVEAFMSRIAPGGTETALMKSFRPAAPGSPGKILVELARGVGGEALEEGITGGLQTGAEEAILHGRMATAAQLGRSVTESAVAGALGAGLFQTPGAVADMRHRGPPPVAQPIPNHVGPPAPVVSLAAPPVMEDAFASRPDPLPERQAPPEAETKDMQRAFAQAAEDAASPEGQARWAAVRVEETEGRLLRRLEQLNTRIDETPGPANPADAAELFTLWNEVSAADITPAEREGMLDVIGAMAADLQARPAPAQPVAAARPITPSRRIGGTPAPEGGVALRGPITEPTPAAPPQSASVAAPTPAAPPQSVPVADPTPPAASQVETGAPVSPADPRATKLKTRLEKDQAAGRTSLVRLSTGDEAAVVGFDEDDPSLVVARVTNPETGQPEDVSVPVDDIEAVLGSATPTEIAAKAARQQRHPAPSVPDLTQAPPGLQGRPILRAQSRASSVSTPQPFSAAETGKPITIAGWRGTGKSKAEIYRGAQVPIAGKGRYVASTEKEARLYGDQITTETVALQNPLVIRSDDEWRRLTRAAGWKYPNPYGASEADVTKDTDNLRATVLGKGHDGLVIQIPPEGDIGKTLRTVFDHDQVVDYSSPAVAPQAPQVPTAPVADKPAAPFTFQGRPAVVKGFRGQQPFTGAVSVTPVGNAHAVVETAQGDFIVAGTSRKSAADSARLGHPVTLYPIDARLGRALRSNERPKPGAWERVRYAAREEAEAAAKLAEAKHGETKPIAGAPRKAAPGKAVPQARPEPGRTKGEIVGESLVDRAMQAPESPERKRTLELLADAQRAQERGDRETAQRLFKQAQEGMPAPAPRTAEETEEAIAAAEAETPDMRFLARANPAITDVGGKSTADVRKSVVDAAQDSAQAGELAGELFDAVMERAKTEARGRQVAWDLAYRRAVGVIRSAILKGSRPQAAMWMDGAAHVADIVHDGMTSVQRAQTLADAAAAFGLNVAIPKKPLKIGRKPVPTVFDPATKTVYMSAPLSVQQGLRFLAHEATHAEVLGLSAADRGALYQEILTRLTDPDAVFRAVRERWGSALPKAEPFVADTAAMDELLADGGAEALLTDQGELIGRLPPRLGARIIAIFKRIGDTLTKIVRSLPGLRGLRKPEHKAARDQIVRLARDLLSRRLDRLRAQAKAIDAELNNHTSFMLALGLDPKAKQEQADRVAEAQVATPEGDMHQGFLNLLAKLVGGRGAASGLHKSSVKAWGALLQVMHRFPLANVVARGLESADQAWRRGLYQFAAGVDPLVGIKNTKQRLAYAELLYALRRKNKDTPFADYADGLTWLEEQAKDKNLDPGLAVEIARAVHSSTNAVRETKRGAVARMLGLDRAYSSAETARLIERYKQAFPEEKDPAQMDRLEAWLEIVTQSEANTDPFYIPYTRLPNDVVLLKKENGKVVHRENVSHKVAKARAAELGGEVEIIPRSTMDERDRSTDPARLIERLTGIAARLPGVDTAQASQILGRLLPALLADSPAARELEARGTPGYEADPREALAYWSGSLMQSIRALESVTNTQDAMKAVAADKARPRLYEFLHSLAYGSGLDDAKDLKGFSATVRLLISARAMWAPVQGLMNTMSAFTLSPWITAFRTGKAPRAVVTAYLETMRTTWDIYAKGVGGLREAIPVALGESGADSWFLKQFMARLPANEAAAVRRAAVDTTVLADPEASSLQRYLSPEANRIALRLNRGVNALQTATDRASRAATFVTYHRMADSFSAADWERAKKRGYHGAQDAYEYAVWGTRSTHGEYSHRFRPEWARMPIGSMAYQFTTWAKQMTHSVHDMTVAAVKETKQGNLEALGLLMGMSAMGVAMHGLASGIPIYGKALALIADALMGGFGDDEDELEKAALHAIAEAEKAGDSSAAFLHRAWAYGLPQALAQTDTPGVRQAAQLTAAVAERASPRGLLYDFMASPRFPPASLMRDVAEGWQDIKQGVKNGSDEAVLRGVTRTLGSPFRRAQEMGPLLEGRGLLRPVPRATGQAAPTMIPDSALSGLDKAVAAVTLALGTEPAQAREARRAAEMMAEADRATTGPLVARVHAAASALRSGDKARFNEEVASLTAYVEAQAKRLGGAKGVEQARILAELTWIRGNLGKRIRAAYLQQQFGDMMPSRGTDALYQDYMQHAAGFGDELDEEETEKED